MNLLSGLFATLNGQVKKMVRTYKCLSQSEFGYKDFKLIPIRDEDKYLIMKWRNEQIDILRQKKLLTKEQQEVYFQDVVAKLFEEEKPSQLIFSFLEKDKLVGYGGLVHIDWESRNGEISFITETSRNNDKKQFIEDWTDYLFILKRLAQTQLNFLKIYTYAYDLRPGLYEALMQTGFIEEARLKNHILVKRQHRDVLIHSCFIDGIAFRKATEKDLMQYYVWANDPDVRKNAFNTGSISLENHAVWFRNKLKTQNCFLYFFLVNGDPAGQVRIENIGGEMSIDISVDKNHRGKNLGTKMLKMACMEYFKSNTGDTLYAYIKKENQPSLKIFQNANFKIDSEVIVKSTPAYRLTLKPGETLV